MTASLVRLPGSILFGAGTFGSAALVIREHGTRALICTDARLGTSQEIVQLRSDLADLGVASWLFDLTEPDVPSDNVDDCVAFAVADTGRTPDVIVGIGGGSCLDLAKASALLLSHGGELSAYYGEGKVPGPTLPVVAIPTTAGTGSEATPVAVIADRVSGLKVGISSPHLIPDVAIVDPRLTASCPASLTAIAGADAVAHLVESYTAIRRDELIGLEPRVFVGKSFFTDRVGLEGLRLMARSLVTAYECPDDESARTDVAAAALAGGIALGTAGTAAAHALQYPIGALTGTAHGSGVGALLPYVMRFNLRARVGEFGEIAAAMGVDTSGLSPLAAARAGILAVDGVLDAIGIPSTLADLGLQDSHLDTVAHDALRSARLVANNPVTLDEQSLRFILECAQRGRRDFDDYHTEQGDNA